MRPVTVRVFGKIYTVEWRAKALDEFDRAGDHHQAGLAIRIADGLAPDEERETLMHELTHSIERQLGINIAEKKVRQLSVGMYAVLKDNPRLRTYLFGVKK